MNTGLSAMSTLRSLSNLPAFLRDLRAYRRANDGERFRVSLSSLMPVLTDRAADAGTIGGHYFHQDLWAARKVYERKPPSHVDIGSRIDGFVAHLLVFMPVTVLDVRSLCSTVGGLTFRREDATTLASIPDGSVVSMSCLHAAEHFGLGRYGDPVDPAAVFKLMRSLARVLAPGGRLYFSVPIGRERVEFNAHRVFDPRTVLDGFPSLRDVSFSFVDDAGDLHEQAPIGDAIGLDFGCGLFELEPRP